MMCPCSFGWFVLCMCLCVVNDNLSCAVLCNNVPLSSLLPVACRRMGTTCVSLLVTGEMSSLKIGPFSSSQSEREVCFEDERSPGNHRLLSKLMKIKRALNILVIFLSVTG